MIAEAVASLFPRAARPGPTDEFWYRSARVRSVSGVDVGPDNAMAVPTVYRCVRLLSELLGSVPLRVYERIGSDRRGRKVADGNELDDVLYNRPNRWQAPGEWVEQMVAHVLLRGNYYAEKLRRPPERELEIAPFPEPSRMQVEQTRQGYLRYTYRFPVEGNQSYMHPSIFHVRGPSQDGITGLSVLEFARNTIGVAISQEDHGAKIFRSGGVPPMWIARPAGPRWDPDAKKNFRKTFRGVTTSGDIPIMEDGMEIRGLEIDNETLQWLESQEFSGRQICRFFGVPPWAVGLEDAPTDTDQAIAQLIKLTLRPWAVRIESAADIQLIDEDGDRYYTKFSLDEIEKASMMTRFEANNIGVQGGWLTRNECRIDEDREPLPGLDEPLEALNMQPAGGTADVVEQGGRPGKGRPVRRERPQRKERDREQEDRKRAEAAFSGLLGDAARRFAAAEINAFAARSPKARKDKLTWGVFVVTAYNKHHTYIQTSLQPLVSAWHAAAGIKATAECRAKIAADAATALCEQSILEIKDAEDPPAVVERWKTERECEVAAYLKGVFFNG